MTADHPESGRHWLAAGLLVGAAFARLIPHPPNVTPLVGVALLGGAMLPKGLGVLVPVLAILASDVVIGLHDVVVFTWGGAALAAMVGWWVKRRPRAGRMVVASVAASTLFFLVTNFGVWLVGHGGAMYPKTAAGLLDCYLAALPFYRNALLGDVGWTLGLFSLYALAARSSGRYALARSR